MMRITFSLFLCLLLACSLTTTNAAALEPPKEFKEGLSGAIQTTTSISQHGITWTFATPVQYGQFINGDYWVIDPGGGVKITEINPGHVLHSKTGRHMNGSMLNPHNEAQGYDGYFTYSSSANVGIGISAETPLVLSGNVSLVSTISNPDAISYPQGNDSYVKTAAVLTCLTSAPSTGSFRPGISSTVKTIHNESSLDYSKLKSLACPISKPNITKYANYFQMVWLDHGGWATRYMRPSDSGLSNYYYVDSFVAASLMLNLDYTLEEKRALLINFIQMGIDLYSFIEAGPSGALTINGTPPYYGWEPDGGNMNGRKWPILFAGIMLNYTPMKTIGEKSGDYLYSNGHGPGNPPPDYIHFAEDGQTFYVSQADVDRTNSGLWSPEQNVITAARYTQSMIGMPEWGIRYATNPYRVDSSWVAPYRNILTGPARLVGIAMAARIMGAKTLWNHNAFFDYTDRFYRIAQGESDPFGYVVPGEQAGNAPPAGYLIKEMYDKYRANY